MSAVSVPRSSFIITVSLERNDVCVRVCWQRPNNDAGALTKPLLFSGHYVFMRSPADIRSVFNGDTTVRRRKKDAGIQEGMNCDTELESVIGLLCDSLLFWNHSETTWVRKLKLPALILQRKLQAPAGLGDMKPVFTSRSATLSPLRPWTGVCIRPVPFTLDRRQCCKVWINGTCQRGNNLMFF